jgi:hypothetical protein
LLLLRPVYFPSKGSYPESLRALPNTVRESPNRIANDGTAQSPHRVEFGEKGLLEMRAAKMLLRRSARFVALVPLAAFLFGPFPALAPSLSWAAQKFGVLGGANGWAGHLAVVASSACVASRMRI